MVFYATFNNISVITVLLVWGNRSTRENHWHAASHWQTLSHMLYRVHLAWTGFELTALSMIDTGCIGSCKSNYHAITATTTSLIDW